MQDPVSPVPRARPRAIGGGSLFPGLAGAAHFTLYKELDFALLSLILIFPSFLRQLAEIFEIRPK